MRVIDGKPLDLVVVGSCVFDYPVNDLPPGDVRAFDARTGAPRWVFHTVPQAGEFGNDTWKNGSWKSCGFISDCQCHPIRDLYFDPE